MEKRGFNIVFQDYALFPNLNVYQNITYGLKNKPNISTKEEVEDLIDLLGLREHLTTIIVTHDPEEALTLSDRVMIVNEGKIAQFGTPEEIINTPSDAFVEKFILNQLQIKKNNIFTLFGGEKEENRREVKVS